MALLLLLTILTSFFWRTCAMQLAEVFHTTNWRDLMDEQDWFDKYTFVVRVKVGDYIQVSWEDVLANATLGEFVPLDPIQSWYDNFLAVMTDGKDYRMDAEFERKEQGSGLLGLPLGEFDESDIFRGAPGCGNGIDLEGNVIDAVVLRTDHETQPALESNRTEHRLNFTFSFEGRPLEPYEDALAKVVFSTGWDNEDNYNAMRYKNGTFVLSVDEYTRAEWVSALTSSQLGMYIALNKFQPSYDSFISLLTDGDDLEVSPYLESKTVWDGGGISEITRVHLQKRLESDIFRNQSGCSNGIDLEGSLIKKISLKVDEESAFFPEWNKTLKAYNFTVLFEGRLLEPYEDALAVVDFSHYGCFYKENITVDFVVINGPRWALQEHFIDFDTVQLNEPLPLIDAYGTHSMHEMLTDGSNGFFHLDMEKISTGASESILLDGEPGCRNGIDLEGSYVEEVMLVLRDETVLDGWCTSISPRLVILGNLHDAPEPVPPCPPCPDSAATQRALSCCPWAVLMIFLSSVLFVPVF